MTGANKPLETGSEATEQTTNSDASETSLQEPPSSTPDLKTQPMTEGEKADAVAALLIGETLGEAEPPASTDGVSGEEDTPSLFAEPAVDDTDEPAGDGDGSGDPGGPDTPLTLADAAEKLGTDAETLYSMQITTGDGEALTVGELKDHYQQRATAQRETEDREADLNSREAQIIADQRVWSMLAQSGQLPEAVINQGREALQQIQQRETDMLYALKPELKDAAKLDNFRRGMVETLGRMGFKPHEIQMADHRQVLVVDRLMKLEKENADLRKRTRKPPPKAGKPNGRGAPGKSRSASLKQAAHGSEAMKVDAVGRLLNGG